MTAGPGRWPKKSDGDFRLAGPSAGKSYWCGFCQALRTAASGGVKMGELAQSCLRLAGDVTFQSMGPGEETVLLSLSSGCVYTCNETTEAFLRALDGRRTLEEIVGFLAQQYDVSPEQLAADMQKLAEKLVREKLVVAEQADDARRS